MVHITKLAVMYNNRTLPLLMIQNYPEMYYVAAYDKELIHDLQMFQCNDCTRNYRKRKKVISE